jgi:integrase
VNPARLVRGPANIHDTQKLPFEPAEIEKILKACREVQIQGCSNDELLAFTLVLRYSGLRIGEASVLTIHRFKGDDLYLYTQKSGAHVFVPLPPFVMNLVQVRHYFDSFRLF